MTSSQAPTAPLVEQAAFKVDLPDEQEAKYERITRRLQEVTSAEIMRKVLSEGRSPVGYWGQSKLTCHQHMLTVDRQCYHWAATYRLLCPVPQDRRFLDSGCEGEQRRATRADFC